MDLNEHRLGFVLARAEREENDLLVTLLLDDGSVQRAWAAGARRSTKRFSGGLSAFSLYQLQLGHRSSNGLLKLREGLVAQGHPGILADLGRTLAAGTLAIALRETCSDVSDSPDAFELYGDALLHLNTATRHACGAQLVHSLLRVLEIAGHLPVLDRCARCARAVPERAAVQLRAHAGGVMCSACGGGPLLLRAVERRALRDVMVGQLDAFEPKMLPWVAYLIEPYSRGGAESLRQSLSILSTA